MFIATLKYLDNSPVKNLFECTAQVMIGTALYSHFASRLTLIFLSNDWNRSLQTRIINLFSYRLADTYHAACLKTKVFTSKLHSMHFTYICCMARAVFLAWIFLTYVQCLQRWNIVAITLPVRILNTYFL